MTSDSTSQVTLSNGVIRFASVEVFLEVHRKTLGRGALAVTSADSLKPLEPFHAAFEIPDHGEPLPAMVQVVSSREDVHLLRLIDDDNQLKDAFARIALGMKPRAASSTETPASTEPAPPQPNHQRASDATSEEQPPMQVEKLSPPTLLTSAPPTTNAPPVLTGQTVVFTNQRAVDQAVAELHQTQGLFVQVLGPAPGFGPLKLKLNLRRGGTSPELAVEVVFAQGSRVGLMFKDLPAAREAFAALIPAAEPATTKRPGTAPVLAGSTITLDGPESVTPFIDELRKSGGALVTAAGTPPAFGPLHVRLVVSGRADGIDLDASVVFVQDDQVALVFSQALEAQQQLEGLIEAASPEPPPPTGVKLAASGLQLNRCQLKAVDSAPAALQLNLITPPDPRNCGESNLIELLAGLGRVRATGNLIIAFEKPPTWHAIEIRIGREVPTLQVTEEAVSFEIPFRGGAAMVSDEERELLLQAVVASGASVRMLPELPSRIAATKRPRDPRGLAADALRRVLREHTAETLELALGSILHRYPLPAEGVSASLFGLRLDAKEARFLDTIVDGTRRVADLPKVSGMLRPATFRIIYVLLIYRLLELRDEARYSPSEDPRKLFEAECQQVLRGNPFEQLGVHWSEHPNMIRNGYHQRLKRFGPDSELCQLAPALAKQVVTAIEAAWHKLREKESRNAVRKTLPRLDVSTASQILAKHAEVASLRGDIRTVREAMEMALELDPRKEYRRLLEQLLQRTAS